MGSVADKFNKKFFGILLNVLLYSKTFSKIPKNFLLNLSALNYKLDFKLLSSYNFNNLSLIKFLFAGLFKTLLENVNYVFLNLNPNEKFVNDSLIKLSFTNFSLGFKFNDFVVNQSNSTFGTQSAKDYISKN